MRKEMFFRIQVLLFFIVYILYPFQSSSEIMQMGVYKPVTVPPSITKSYSMMNPGIVKPPAALALPHDFVKPVTPEYKKYLIETPTIDNVLSRPQKYEVPSSLKLESNQFIFKDTKEIKDFNEELNKLNKLENSTKHKSEDSTNHPYLQDHQIIDLLRK